MRVLALLLPALFASAMALYGQTQSIQYEMKLLRVYQDYPHDDHNGPDITWKARAIINGLGPNPIAGPTGQIHLPNLQTTGWFDAGAQTIASGTMTYTAANTFNLCSDNISVNMELEGWEEDCDTLFHFRNLCDGHRFGAAANGVGNARLAQGSGVTRVFQLLNFSPNIQNRYYGFEVSLTYTLTNGIREVVYAGNAQGGPVADVCEGGNYFVFARTGPGFSGGDFEFQRSDNNGATWTTVQTGASPAYRVTATANPGVLYRVRLRGGFGCLGYANNEGWVTPAGAGNLRVIPTFNAADVNYTIQSSCEGDALSNITVSSINNLPPNTSVAMQLSAPDDPFFVSPNPGLVSLPYTWQNLEPGRYRLNVTGVLINGESLPTGQCTQDIFIQIAPVTLPAFTGLIPANPGCDETTGSVTAIISTYNAGLVHSWQVFAVGNTTTPVATGNQQASSVEIGNLPPGDYFVRLTLNGTCVVNSGTFTIAAPPASASGTAQVVYPGAATTVLCPDGKTTVNFSVAAGTGQNSVQVYLATALNNPLASGTASPGSPFSTQLIPGNYTAVFQRADNGCQEFENFTILNSSNALLVSVAATTKPPACTPLGGTLTLSVTGGTPPYTFKINGVVRTPTSTTGNNRLFNQLPSGRGIYEVTDANGCNVGVQRFTVPAWVSGAPIFEFRPFVWPQNVVDVMTCNGGNDGYFWYEPVGGTGPFQARVAPLDANYGPAVAGTAPQIRENLPPGVYTVYMRDAANCETAQVAYIEEFPAITITKVVLAPMYCGQTHTTMKIYATGLLRRTIAGLTWQQGINWSLNGADGLWYSGSNMAEDPADPNGVIITMNNISPQNYHIIIRQQKGPAYASGGYAPAYATQCFSPVFPLTAADFNVPTPVAVTTQLVSPTCNGETNGRITVNFTGGNPGYELTLVRFNSASPHPNPTVMETVVLASNAPGTYTFTNLPPGSYGVQVRTAIVDGGASNLPGSCTSYFPGNWNTSFFAPYTLANPSAISINTISTVTPLQCDLTGGQITVQSVSGGTPPYRYSVNGVDFSTNNLLPALSQNTVYVRDANSCQATRSYAVTAVVNPSLALSFAATPPANCVLQGLGTFTITPGTPPYKVEYATSMSGGQLVNPVIIQTSDVSLPLSGLTPGSLFVKITDAGKCVKSYTFTVPSVSAPPLTAFTSARNRQTCPNINNGSLTVTAQGGIAPYQILYNGVTTTGATRSLSNLGPGSYLFNITDAAGCTTSHEVVMEAAAIVSHTQSFTAVGPCTDSGNGSVTISPQGGAAPYVISWSDGAPPQIVDAAGGSATRSNLNRQEYIFTIAGSGPGCSMVSSIYPPGPDVPFVATLGMVSQPQCAGVNNGSIAIQASGGTGPYTYSSNGGGSFQSSATFAGLSAGTYNFIARDAAGCERSVNNVQINNVQAVTAGISPSNVLCFGQNNGSITVTPSGGMGPYTLSVNGGTPSSNLTAGNLIAGNYSVVVRDANGCLFSNPSVNIAQPAALALNATPIPPACNGSTGSISLSATGGTGAKQYRLVGGTYSTNNIISNLAVGSYDVQVRDANGCETTLLNVQVPGPQPIVIQLQGATPEYCNRDDGTATVSASGGTGGLSYAWSNGNNGPTATGLSAGDATVTVTDQSGCTNTLVVTITAVAGPSISGIAVQNAICTNDNGTATVNFSGGTGMISINWSNNGMGASLTGLSSGNYTVTVTDAVGCSASQMTTVNFVPAHTLSTTQNDENCDQGNGSITVNASGGSGNFSYAWPSGVIATGNSASNLSGGTYVITVTDNTRGCVVSTSVTLNNTPAVSANFNVSDVLCNGQSNGSITVVPLSGTAPFSLSVNGSAPSSNLTAGGLAAGTYSVVVSDVNGCTFSNPAVMVGEPGVLILSATPNAPSCFGGNNGSITLSANGGTGAYQYRLTGGAYSTNNVISNLNAGVYEVQVRDANGCETTLSNVMVAQPSAVVIQLVGTTPEFCGRADGTATVSASGGTGTLNFTWPNNQSGPTATGLAQGSYGVTVTDENGCTASLLATVGFVPAHTLSTTQNDENCDQGNGSITVNVSGGSGNFSYAWPSGVIATGNSASNLSGGTYVITVTDNTRGCVVSTSVTLNNTPAVSANFNVSDVLCNGQSNGSITVVPLSGTAPFSLSVNGSAPSSNLTAGGLAMGTYSVVVSDLNGCTFSNPAVMVGEPGVLILSATPNAPSCFGGNNGSITLSANGGTGAYQYRLTGGAYSTNNVISNLNAGVYEVQVRDANGCETTLSNVMVAQPSAVVIQLVGTTPEFCDRADGTATVSASGGTGTLNFTWSNNQTGPMATGLEQGSYGVTATDANGCTASIPNISISETPPVTLGIAELLHSLCDEGNGHITVSATGAPGPFSYSWSHHAGLNSPTASSLNSGTYTVTVTDGNNCSAQISATVLLRPRPVLAPPAVTLAACMGNTGSVQVSVQSGGTAPFNYAWSHNAGLNSGWASNLPTGSYTCTVTDFYGCTAEVTAFVGELPPPQATVGVTTALCSLPNGSAQVSATGGTLPYTYTWSNGAPNAPTAQNLAAGDYTVTVTDFYGCQDVESFTVGNIPGPSALNVSFQNSICTNSTGSITVIPQGGTAPFNYGWSHNPFLNLPTASLLPGGTYSVTATDANGCVISATQVIQFQPSPVIQTLQQRNSLCTNGNGLIEITATGAVPFSYTWTNGVSTGPLAQNLNVGSYTVTVTDANLCTNTRSFTISLEPAPAVQLLQITNDICGQAIGAIRINAIGGAQPITYSWSHNPGLNSNWPTGLLAGNYSVTLTDANGCTATTQYAVGGTPGPTMQLQSVGTAFCGNAVGAVGVQATGGLMPYTYSWSHNPTLNSPIANNLLPGMYSVTVTDANNCPATVQAQVPGTLPPVLTLTGVSENPCVPNDVVIETTILGDHPPFQYAWSHNAGLNSLTAGGLSSGTYALTATDIHGCQSILSTSVTDLRSPEMAIENVTPSRCNANDGSISVSVGFGLQPYTYTWSHNAGLNSGSASGLAPGQYAVTVTDANGCTDQVSATVTELPPPFVFVTATTSTCSLPNGSAQSFVSGGTAPYTYIWSSGSPNTPVAQNLPAGNYTLTVSDAFGCIGVQSFSVGDVPGPSELQVSFQNSICNNFNGAITVSPQGGTGPFHYNWSHNVFLNHPTATNLPAGNYSVTATDATGCVISASQTILFQPPPTIETVQLLNSLCANGAGLIEIAVTGAGPFGYAWTNGVSTGPLAQNLNAGNYTVTVTDANGCTATRSFTIGSEPGPAILLISQTNDVCGQGIGSIRIRSSEGLAPLTFSWSHNSSLNSDWPTGLSAGHYSVTVTDANGCTATSQYTITETSGPELQVTNTTIAFCGNPVGSVNVQPLGGTAPYNYVWSHNAGLNSAFAGNLLPGTYSVTVTDANGCTATATATVGSTTSPFLTLIGTSENPCLEQDAAIAFAIQGGAMPYTYAWSHNPALNSLSANGLASGTYTITATDANGCQASLSATVTDRRGPALQIESIIQSSCGFADGSASVSVSSGQAPYLFSWSHNSALSGNTAAGLAAGSYLVTVTDSNGCTDVEQINISDSQGPQAVISQTNDAVCTPDNGSMSVSVQAGTTPYAYSWSHAPALNSPDAAGLAPGTYSVTITDANGCLAVASGNIGFQAPPVATAVVFNAVCEPNTGSIEVSVSGGRSPYSIVWNTTALSGFNPAPVFAGSYSATITDANGCETVLPVSVNFFAGPQVLLVEQQNASCQQSDGSIQIGEAGGTPPYAYDWSHDPNLNFFVANNLSAGTYTVTVTDANGCTATLTATLTDIPSATLTLTATNSICGQSNGSVTANVIGGAWPLSFSWSHNATLNSPTAAGLSAGSYSLTVTEANGCQSTATIQVSDAAGVSASVSNFTNAVCDANTGSISIIASGGEGPYSYAWSHDAGLNAPNATSLPAGIYTITVTDADGCRDVVAQTLSFTPGPQLALTTTTNTFCENGNGALSFSASGGTGALSFQWSHDVNLNAASVVGLNAGSYTITATDANGCTAVQTAQVGFIAGPQLSIASQTNTYCDNEAGAISLALSGGTGPMQFVWSHDADLNAADAGGLSAGTYSATATDANGCTAAISVVITDIPGFTLPAPIVQQANCAQSDGAVLLMPSGGQPPFQYQWSHDADLDGPSAGNLAAGLYQVTVTDAGGCVRNLTIEVQTTDGPAPAIAQLENASCGQANGSIATTLSGGQAPYTYLWSNGSTEPSVSGLAGGTYQLTVTDANGCIGVLSANILQGAAPMLQLLNADPTGCTNAVGALQFGASGGQVPYTYAWSHNVGLNSASASGLMAGTYSVTLTDAAGCTATSGGEVRVQTDLSLSLVQTQNAICTSATGSAQVSGTGGQAPYSFVWSHDAGLHSGNANGLAAGSYSVTITDGAGCTAELSFVVGVQNVTLQLSILQNSDTDCNQANGSIEMQTTGGQLPYSYNWSHAAGLNSHTADNLAAGAYTVTATDANGCTGTLTTSISERGAPVVSVQTTNSWCDQATGTATVPEAGNFSYAWENVAQPGIILSNNSTATGLSAGAYHVTVTNEQGCSTVQTANIQDLPDMLLNMASTSALCFEQANGMASVSVNGGTGPFQFVWDNGQTAANISSLRAGVYSVTATDANGCIAFGSVSVAQPAALSVNFLSSNQPSCEASVNGSLAVQVSGGTQPYDFQWDSGQQTANISGLGVGDYHLTVTDANGCQASFQVSLTAAGSLNIAVSTTAPTCAGLSNGAATVTTPGAFSYQWSVPGAGSSVGGLSPGTYFVTVSTADGCATVRSFEIPAASAIVLQTSSTPSCLNELNGTATATATGGAGGFSYSWSNMQSGATISNLLPGIIAVTATDANGCTQSEFVIIPGAPFPTLSVVNILPPDCSGQNPGAATVLATGGTGMIAYQWNDPQSQTGPEALNLSAGIYEVIATDENGCSSSVSVELTPPADFLLAPGAVSHPSCFGETNGSAAAVVQGGSGNFSYQWNDPAAQTGPQATNLAAGTYTVSVTDNVSGCIQLITVQINHPALLQLAVVNTADVPCAGQNTGSAAVMASGGTGSYSYLWNDAAAQTGSQATSLAAGNYTVIVTDANGCTAQMPIIITEPPVLHAQLTSFTPPLCFGQNNGSATVSVTGGTGSYSYLWNDPAQQNSATAANLAPGDYSVSVRDANNCATIVSVNIPATPAIIVAVLAQSDPVCAGDSNGSLSVSATGGTGTLNYLWSNGQSGPNLSNLPAGNYALSVTDGNGCVQVKTFDLMPAPEVTIQLTEAVPPICANVNTGRIGVTASGGAAPFSYLWSNGAAGAMIAQLAGGQSYQVTATNAAGCSQTFTVNLAGGAVVEAAGIPADTTLCADDVLELDLSDFLSSVVSGPGGFSDDAPTVFLETAGTYSIALESPAGCRDTFVLSLSYTANVLVAGMVLPSDVVVSDSVVILETSWPAPDTVLWNFDPTRVSIIRQEQNQYWFRFSEPGRYSIGMTARQGGCEDVILKDITVHADSSTIPSAYLGALKIVSASVNPNPSSGIFQVAVVLSGAEPVFVSLYNSNGVLVDRRRAEGLAQYSFDYDLRGQGGTYLVLVQTAQDRRTLVALVLE